MDSRCSNSLSPFISVKSNCSPFRLCYCAVFFVVLLRIAIGWHFLYEGVHKFDPAAEFSAEGFLGIAKGATAELYYWMLPDLDGIQRLEMGTIKDENDEKKELDTFIVYENAWKEYFKEYLVKHSPLIKNSDEAEDFVNMGTKDFADWVKSNVSDTVKASIAHLNKDKDSAKVTPAQLTTWGTQAESADSPEVVSAKKLVSAKAIYNQYLGSLRTEATDAKSDVEAFIKSRERFLTTKKNIRNDASFEQERRWNSTMKYRREAAAWTRMFNEMGNALQSDLGRLVDPALAGQKGEIVTVPEKELFPPNAFGIQYQIPKEISSIECPVTNLRVQSRMDALDLSVMFGLSAIGLCMILGFCNRLACLGGAAFLVNVVLTTWPVPGVYPAIPSMVGNFMFVSKDVVELVALLFLASIPAGRWAGLDYFLWHCGGKQIVWLMCYPFSGRQKSE